jgi:heptaprenyl diphosphate synthase
MIKANSKTRFDVKTITLSAILTALALIISVVEQALPLPAAIPGIKLGLANVVTVYALYTMGPVPALAILIVRCLLGSVFAGTVTSLIFSLCGGLLAYIIMLLLMYSRYISPIGVCIGGAAAHNIGQILAAMKVLGSSAPLTYLPVLLFVSILTGLVTGVVSWIVLGSLSGVMRYRTRVSGGAAPADSATEPVQPALQTEPETETIEDVLASVDRLINSYSAEGENEAETAYYDDADNGYKPESGTENITEDVYEYGGETEPEYVERAEAEHATGPDTEDLTDAGQGAAIETFEEALERIARSREDAKTKAVIPGTENGSGEVSPGETAHNIEARSRTEAGKASDTGKFIAALSGKIAALSGKIAASTKKLVASSRRIAALSIAALSKIGEGIVDGMVAAKTKLVSFFKADEGPGDTADRPAGKESGEKKKSTWTRFRERFDEWYHENEQVSEDNSGDEDSYEDEEYER